MDHTTSAELRARVALDKYGFHHSHSLGQNFLLDEGLLGELIHLAGISSGDRVLEIGPGAGVMTALLAGRCESVVAVELDQSLEPVLNDVLTGLQNVEVYFQDFMKSDVSQVVGEGEYRVVANLPYYITADILQKLVTAPRRPESIAIMVQREAAERITSRPGTKSWCALAALIQSYGETEVLRDVPPEAFSPPPHVMSQFILISRHGTPLVTPRDEGVYRHLIAAAFAMRRKTLLNNLKAAFSMDQPSAAAALEAAGLDPKVRGEALSLQELSRLSDVLSDHGARSGPGK